MKRLVVIIIIVFGYSFSQSQNPIVVNTGKQAKIVGLTYVVFTSDKTVEAGNYGIRRIDNDTSYVKLSDRFYIASNTKAITALFAAKLVEQKKIQWQTAFFELFPDMKTKSRKDYWNITLQDLLCHRAHIQPYLMLDSSNAIYYFTGAATEQRKQFCLQVLNQAPAIPDSSTYVYSNAGIVLAACMLEKASGKSWESMVNEYLNTNLKIPFQLGFPNQYSINEPWGHTLQNGSIVELAPNSFKVAPVLRPAADLNISVEDYMHFIQLFMKGYEGHNNFIKAQTYNYILTAMPDYSFGWMRKTINGKEFNFHYGNAGIFCSCVEYDRTDGIAVIVLANYADANSVNAIETMADNLIAEKLKNKTALPN